MRLFRHVFFFYFPSSRCFGSIRFIDLPSRVAKLAHFDVTYVPAQLDLQSPPPIHDNLDVGPDGVDLEFIKRI